MLSRQDYIDNILDHHDSPRNRRRIDGADIDASGGNPGCGDIVVIFAKVGDDGRITDVSFEGEGCTISQAGASMLTEEILGKTLSQVTEMTFESVVEEMGKDVVTSRTRCATLALSTVKSAADQYLRESRARTENAKT